MVIDGKVVPEYKANGPEWRDAMRELDKETIVSILKTKCEEVDAMHEKALEGVPDQGLQIQSRWMDGSKWCPLADAEKFHEQLQEQHGKNMNLSVDISELQKQIEVHVNCEKELREGLEKACGQRDGLRDALEPIADSSGILGPFTEYDKDDLMSAPMAFCRVIAKQALKDAGVER